MFTPRQIIDDIRKKEYGIGLPPNEEYQEVVAKLRAKVDRALKPLSKDLYAKSIHFVLELVQNAEDNNYASGVLPEIRFILNEKAILVQNNELGFAEENVRSLCDVAKSSKLKRLGYIGEKGIGFKSVFKVSDEPYISSNGYSFSLPIHDPLTNLGYIIPVWQEKIPAGIKPNWTNILLPLTQNGKLEAPKVANIHPSLLLFLKKLRRIGIHDATGTCTNQIYREGEGNSVQIISNAGTDHWRVVRRVLPVPTTVTEEKRVDVLSVEIVLAFPLVEDGTANSSFEHSVYSFLPIRSFGFRFAIQADFILSSSREDILSDIPWNQWLRDAIPSLFLEAVELFKSDDNLRTTYLSFVPSAKTVTDPFFLKIPGVIVDLLKESACILTASGQWAKPSVVLIANDSLRELLTNEDAIHHFKKEYISKEFEAESTLLKSIGVKSFTFSDLVFCLRDTDWILSKGEKWLVELYAFLSAKFQNFSKEESRTLFTLKLVLMENGSLDSPANGDIFFPLAKRENYGFEEGLRIVKKSLLHSGDSEVIAEASRFLKDFLYVCYPEPIEVINKHILPVFINDNQNTNWQSKDDGFCLGAIEYIKDHLDLFIRDGGDKTLLIKSLRIKIINSECNLYGNAEKLYLSEYYDAPNKLEELFDRIAGIYFVDPVYLEHSLARLKESAKNNSSRISNKQKLEQVESWKKFFIWLGVATLPRIINSPKLPDPSKITSPDLEKIIQTKDITRIANVLKILDDNWDNYRFFLEADHYSYLGKKLVNYGKTHTAFYKLLTSSEWIPTQSHGLCKPSQVCIDCPENKELLGDNVPYLSVSLTNEDLIANLDLQKKPSVSATLACLRELAGKPTVDTIKIHPLYAFLNKHFDRDSGAITKAFQDEALIYTPEGLRRFHSWSDVYWKDMSNLFGKKRGYLSKYWRDLKDFFIEKLHVRKTPDPEDYVALLKELSQTNSLDSNEVSKVWDIYIELEKNLKPGDNDEDPTEMIWWKDFISSKLFWTDREEFWHNDDNVYINDQNEYYELFKGKGSYAFLALPENQFPNFRHLINAGKLQMLSESVKVCEVMPRQPRQNQELTALLRDAAPFIIRYLYFKDIEVYRALGESEALSELISTNVHMCDGMTVAFELHGERIEVERDVAGNVGRLYVRNGLEDIVDCLGVVVSNLLRRPRGLDSASFICHLLGKKNKKAMERLMETQSIPLMPVESFAPWSATTESLDEAPTDDTSAKQTQVDQPIGVPEWNEEHAGETELYPESQESEGDDATTPKVAESERTSRRPRLGQGESKRGGEGTSQPRSGQGEAERERMPKDWPAQNWFRILASPSAVSESTIQGQPPPKDDLAREKVIEYEQRLSRSGVAAPPNQEGYDVSSDDQLRGVTRRIEVKGLQQRWTGDATVALTGPQFDASRRKPPGGFEYWLYVVDGLSTDSPRIHPILRPGAKVERVYLQAQDWLSEVDQTDRDRLTDNAVADLEVPIIEFSEIASINPSSSFVTRYPKSDLEDIVPVGGFLKCQPLDPSKELPPKGSLVMLLPAQFLLSGEEQDVVVGEFRWSVRQSLEGEPLYVEVSLRRKTPQPGFGPVTIRVTMGNWPSFRPYAVCQSLLDT